MDDACLRLGIPYAHEWLVASVHEERDRAVLLVLDDAQVGTLRPNRPVANLRETMRGSEPHRVFDVRVIPYLHTRVVPPVVAVTHVAPVVERYPLLEQRRP